VKLFLNGEYLAKLQAGTWLLSYRIVLSQVDAASDGCGVQLSNNSPSPKYSTVSPAVDDDDCGRESSGHGVYDVSRPVNATQHASTSTEQTADRQVYQPTYSITL